MSLSRGTVGEWLTLAIDDPGSGASIDGLPPGGPGPASTKPGGLGLGLTLARASIDRLGGRLVFEPSPGGGTRTRVVWPLAALAVDG